MVRQWIIPSVMAFIIVASAFFYAGSCQPARAQGVTVDDFSRSPALSSATSHTSVEAHWIYGIVGSDASVTVFIWLLNLGAASVLAWLTRKEWKNERTEYCVKFLTAGIRNTYVEYVRGIKEGSVDGKLTELEKEKARKMATDYAVGVAKNQGMDLVKILGKEYIPVLIEFLVGSLKRRDVPLV